MAHPPPPLRLGSLELETPVIYSPLAGCSDYPFRQMVRRYTRCLMFCEMAKMDALVRYDQGTFSLLEFSEEMHPIGGQIVGSKPELAAKSAQIIEELGFDLVDLNCGCPVDKVTKDGSGSGLLQQPQKIGEIIANMRAAVKIPVTVKIRAGWDADHLNAPEIVKIAEEAGAAMITIHGRTRSQGYTGQANRDLIRSAKQAATTIKVAGNGDIFDVPSALHMFEHTGCDAIMISRGTMGNPALGEMITRALCGEAWEEPTPEERLHRLIEHLECIRPYRNSRRAALDIRRVGCWYCKESRGISDLRSKLSRVQEIDEAKALVLEYACSS
ncbi:MAG: tRNA dihydrouridine synthase DusB [Parachlamydiales bacterium]